MTDNEPLDPLTEHPDARVRLVERVAPHALALGAGRRRFSGFFWREGLAVAADEALPEGKEEVRAMPGARPGGEGRPLAATVVGRDASTDVALLRVDGEGAASAGAAVRFSDRPAAVGQSILVVGAGEHGPVVAGGLVASAGPAWRSLRGGLVDARVELDVRLTRSLEGAAVFDVHGDALGMAVSGPRRRVLLIPGATIERVAAALERDGRIPRGRIGAALQSIALDGGGHGLIVASVEPEGPAARAGLHQGDLVVALDGEPLGSLRTLMRRLGPGSVGGELTLRLRRGGEERELVLVVAERAAA